MPSAHFLKLVGQKALLNLWLDLHWIFAGPISFKQRLQFLFQKYRSIFLNLSHVHFLRHDFYYDNRLTPALMTDYVFEIRDLDETLDFNNVLTILDIGGNIGQFAFTVKAKHPHLKIFSFEPNPIIFPTLLKNSSAFADWKCFNFAVGESEQTLPLYFVKGKSSQGSLFRENATQGLTSNQVQNVSIQIRTLNETLQKELQLPNHFDFIKIDVEGAELSVLKALQGISWNYLYIELSEGRLGGASLEQALAILKQSTNQKITVIKTSTPNRQGQTFQTLFAAK